MKIGLYGAGRIGAFHAKTLSALPGVDELRIADVRIDRAREVAAQLGARAVPDPEALLSSGVDAVVITSPTPTHAPLVLAAVEAGVPAFCEKPVALSVADNRTVAAAVAASGTPVMVGFQRRCDPAYLALRDMLARGQLGRPYLVRMVTGDDAPPPADYLPASGGIFRDQSIHDFDVLRWLTGSEVVEVYADGSILTGADVFQASHDVDTAAVVLRLASGVLGTLTGSRHSGSGYDVRIEVAGSRGTGSVGVQGGPRRPDRDGVALAQSPPGGFVERFAESYRREMRHFVEVAAGRATNRCTVEDALAAMLIAEAADRSRIERRPVRVDEQAPAARTVTA
jgi:myo-inositol 2-dehydrogenase/D-chiro-inositol 1-dehydrogenase